MVEALSPEQRRNNLVWSYFTTGEKVALKKLAVDVYKMSVSEILREAFAHYVYTQHPELKHYLRSDLKSPLTP